MSRPCAWCGKSDGERKSITVEAPGRLMMSVREHTLTVHPEHEELMRSYVARFRAHGRRFLILVGLFGILVPVLAPLLSEAASLAVGGSSCVALGIVIFVYPFATPETIVLTGARTARILVRGAAVLTMGIGGLILMLAF